MEESSIEKLKRKLESKEKIFEEKYVNNMKYNDYLSEEACKMRKEIGKLRYEIREKEKMNGSDKNVGSIEKLIEELTKVRPDELSKGGLKLLKYINEIIDRNKELEEKMDKDTHTLQNALDLANADKINNYIPVSLVEEKIEELDEELEIMKVDAMYGRYKEYGSKLSFEKQFGYKYGMHDVLQELLEKRE